MKDFYGMLIKTKTGTHLVGVESENEELAESTFIANIDGLLYDSIVQGKYDVEEGTTFKFLGKIELPKVTTY